MFLQCHRMEGGQQRLEELWRVTLEGKELLPLSDVESVSGGETREHLYENAIVTLLLDPESAQAEVTWVFGPLHGHSVVYPMDDAGNLNLGSGRMGWIS